jgi:peptidoglycan/LPS O-acetylase OafA/YrhL
MLSALISALCCAVIVRDAIAKPRPDKIAWAIAFALFAIAAASEAYGSLREWTPALVRTYYLTGAVLVVGYLALGQLYLLAGKRIARFAPGVAIGVTAFAATLVFGAPVDETKLAEHGWEALEKSTTLTITTVFLNAGGTFVIVGGLIYSAWKFKRLGIMRNRMIGLLLIAVGTLVVAMGGTATRLGEREYFYVMMTIGVALIFAGYLVTRQPDGQAFRVRRAPAIASAAPVPGTDPALVYIEETLLPLAEAEIVARCREWSVEPDFSPLLRRDEAILAWQLRTKLSPVSQVRYDDLSVTARRQIVVLHDQVLTANPAEIDALAHLLPR